MTTTTHENTHGAARPEGIAAIRKSLRRRQLPLLGSNQDSSDPESRALGRTSATAAGKLTTDSPRVHTESHTVGAIGIAILTIAAILGARRAA